ncbi:hypothetical protein [Urechidicola vernalis]|uniref:Uncharacterized protein n=1 Tax=Urechidicola vernalis TaxID=3075600 RepID=A0ABU2Y7C0_9FLAO|nr:hypothetical protein [Urechidicola sp. P050]MDT0553721.1 hypothetical protein [Urechidicola sp. P050]
MHKRLEAELVSLAHTILQMKNRNDVNALKEKARELHERLSVLAFVDEYLETTSTATETKEELLEKIEVAVENNKVEIAEELLQVEEVEEKIEIQKTEEPVETVETKIEITQSEVDVEEEVEEEIVLDIESPEENDTSESEAVKTEPIKQLTIEEEFKDAVSADVTTNLFSKAEDVKTQTKTSLNDVLQKNIQVGLNDRIAFVKHLFNHSQADFNRVLSQLNSFKTEKEAKNFIKKMVKPDYDWTGKEEFEGRFINLIERKFL